MKEIQLSNSEKKALIDDDDYYRISLYTWKINSGGYAGQKRKRRPRFMGMSRFIMRYEGELQVDHINGNRLDNRKANLRVVTAKENCNNRHSSRKPGLGVTYNKRASAWQAYVWTNKKIVRIPGYHKTKEDALLIRAAWIEKNPIVLVGPIKK
jgi:hypothetical protein